MVSVTAPLSPAIYYREQYGPDYRVMDPGVAPAGRGVVRYFSPRRSRSKW